MVFVTSLDKKDLQVQDYMEKETFKEERFALGAKFFNLVKIPVEGIPASGPMAKVLGGAKLPRLVFMSRDGKHVRKLEGRTSGSKAFGAMQEIVKKDLGYDLGKFVRSMAKLLNDMDGLDNDQKQLAAKKNALQKEKGGGRKPQDLEQEESTLAQERERIQREMAALLQEAFPVKDEKKETVQAR